MPRLPIEPVPLATLPTPLERADRLGAHLGFDEGRLWIKRDDLTGLAGGGNKARKLEYLCADAIARGCDVLVTGGGRQSNHVRMTAAAANKLGLDATVVLASGPPETPSGNVVLDYLLGADIVWGGDLDYYGTEAAITAACERLRSDHGRTPYAMPVGGASTTGELGYVAAADELVGQLADHGLDVGVVVTADGSGGTHAGLVAGLGDHAKALGVDVGTRPDLDDRIPEKALAAASAAGRPAPTGDVRIDHDRLEGLVLDPVYSGKAMAGLIAARREARIAPDATAVFLHTGGMPALFTTRYATWIRDA
jgi:1-aminocyclopropane-1-carboxylate deaminase/D-cysteine desulfhydrase-like pyridoxal-dependent ACC family enzyme